MTVPNLNRTVLWLLVAVLLESMVAVVLRIGSVTDFLDGDRSWTELVSLSGLGVLALLLIVTLSTVRTLLGLWQQLAVADSRIAVLEASAMMSRAQAPGQAISQAAHVAREFAAARQRVLDMLDKGNLTIAMQPIVDLERDRWVAAEALARFPDGRGPDVWFREAHDAGFGVELELLAATMALDRALELPLDIGVSINVSPSLILDPRLAAAIYRSTVALERLTLEIAEHATITGYVEIRAALLPMRERGLLLAVDETGAGNASFSHVMKLRPDVIKLDRSMIADVVHDPAKRAFVTAVVLLALELDATITAEGVETSEELDTVVMLGVDHAQGNYLGRSDTSVATWLSWAHRRWTPVRIPASRP